VEILEVRNLSKCYVDGFPVLQSIGFKVEQGEFLGVIGGSGAGKSTLLRCINCLVEPSGGEIIVPANPFFLECGQARIDVLQMGSKEIRLFRRKVGMIFQQFNIVKRLTVMDNVLSGSLGSQPFLRSSLRFFPREEKKRALENLRRVGLLQHAYKRGDELSGGEQQRVAIARTLMQRPVMILADEPVASLDPKLSQVILEILRRVCREDGITALVSLHTLELTRHYADRVIGLQHGRIVFDGSSDELTDGLAEAIYGQEERA
jgi:phosphonate transport system ATP-binding protein